MKGDTVKVWIVSLGPENDQDGEDILAVYSSEEKAAAYCQRHPQPWLLSITSHEVDVDPPEDIVR